MRRVDLTDDELWQAIAENTDAMSKLIMEQLEMDEEISATVPAGRAKLMGAYLEAINQYQREYRDYTAELRRRHKIWEASGVASPKIGEEDIKQRFRE